MTDPRSLLAGLEEYSESLSRHAETVRSEFEVLERAWAALSAEFEGNAAEEFRPLWQATAEGFRTHVEQATRIATVLDGRIEKLRSFDTSDGLDFGDIGG